MPENSFSGTPQFGTAEYERKTGGDYCQLCNQSIVGRYYRVNGSMVCPSCADRAQRETPKDSHGAFVRGLLLGAVAALIGIALYAAFEIMTGITIGYASLAVGFLIGKAIMIGSKGAGGRRYQIAAAVFTYAAVSVAAVPVMISEMHKQKVEHQQVQMKQHSTSNQGPASQQDQSANQSSTNPQDTSPSEQKPASPKMGLGAALLGLLILGLLSPFLELASPLYGLIGLVILFVGIRIAWRITAGRPVQIDGPYDPPAPESA